MCEQTWISGVSTLVSQSENSSLEKKTGVSETTARGHLLGVVQTTSVDKCAGCCVVGSAKEVLVC
jgi:hypothetical protein